MQKLKVKSFYLFNQKQFEINLRSFREEFQSRYSNLIIGYSYKTNYLPSICKIANNEVACAEVVSSLEYNLAKTICPDTNIIYNGPLKSKSSLEQALLEEQIVNLDGTYEIEYLESISIDHPDRKFKVGLRCAFALNNELPSRFGFDSEGGRINAAFKRINALPNFTVTGLHCHFSARDKTQRSFRERCKKIISIADNLFVDYSPEYIDIGGGFYSKMKPKLLKTLGISEKTSYRTYAEEITAIFNQRYPHQNVTLILEPGRAVVADTIQFYCSVIDIKKIGNRNIALVSASIHNIKPQGARLNLPFELFAHDTNSNKEHSSYDIVGYTCMENDILFNNYKGVISPGDYIKYSNMGAYVQVFKPQFIGGQFPIIKLDSKGEVVILKRATDHKDFLNSYNF